MKNILNDMLFFYSFYYLSFILHQQFSVKNSIRALKSGRQQNYQLVQTLVANFAIFLFINLIILFEDRSDLSLYVQYRQLYLAFFLIVIQIWKIPQLTHTLIENPLRRIRTVLNLNKEELPIKNSYYGFEGDDSNDSLIKNSSNLNKNKYFKDNNQIKKSPLKNYQQQNDQNSEQSNPPSKFKKFWVILCSGSEFLFIVSLLISLILESIQIFIPNNIVDKANIFYDAYSEYFNYEKQIMNDDILLEIYRISIKITFIIYTHTETASIQQTPKKNILKQYREELALQQYIQGVSNFFLTMILIIALYPSMMLTLNMSDCYLKTSKQTNCKLSLLGETTLEILNRQEIFYLQYIVLLYTIIQSLYKLCLILFRK